MQTRESFAAALTQPSTRELPFLRPLLPAAGCFGYGEAYAGILDVSLFGAVVTRPITYRRRMVPQREGATVLPLPAGCLIAHPQTHPGLSSVLSQHRARWQALSVPLICHLSATDLEETRKAARRLDAETAVAALELGLPHVFQGSDRTRAQSLVSAARRRFEKPLLVRLPLQGALDLAPVCVQAGADALVATAPPLGAVRDPAYGHRIHGDLYGPWVKAQVLPLVEELRQLVPVPIVACGGVHSLTDVREYLAAGAIAVQIDSLLWRDPATVASLAEEINAEWDDPAATVARATLTRDRDGPTVD